MVCTFPELTLKEKEIYPDIVGGCGIQLDLHKLQRSEQGVKVLANYGIKLHRLVPEAWKKVKLEDGSIKAIFRLQLEDVPAGLNDNYEWMQSLLLIPKDTDVKDVETYLQLEELILSNDESNFKAFLNNTVNLEKLKIETALRFTSSCTD